MGKNEKTGLGRALVKQHNHMIQESKEKGRFYKSQQKKVLESVTEVSDIAAILERSDADADADADEVADYDNDHAIPSFNFPTPNLPITLDVNPSGSETSPEERMEIRRREEALHASSLRIPRRPHWNAGMSVEELDANEKQSFLTWRRNLARLEENESLVLTPFEKNLDIWRQLWRVVERSDLIVMVVDARDPLFYRCPDLEAYAREVDENKRTMLLVNKADLLPHSVRKKWAEYFRLHQILFVFWSAKAAFAAQEGKPLSTPISSNDQELGDTKIFGKDELLSHIQAEAEKIAKIRRPSSSSVSVKSASKTVTVGFVGYPNVGKSSTINALVGQKRTGVTSTPGKTKHFQTLIISEELTLCDCPGLVFPSFTSSRHEMVASGVLPIDRLTEHREAVQVVADRVQRSAIEEVYNIKLPKPKSYESQSRPPLATELLKSYCASRGYVASSGLPDETKGARQILKDYLDGKLPHYEMPPGELPERKEQEGDFAGARDSDSSEADENDDTNNAGPTLEHVLDDLNTFDVSEGLVPKKADLIKKTNSNASHKQHRKPQRKKDRSWRVGNDGGDGMPAVRGLQKVPNMGPLNPR